MYAHVVPVIFCLLLRVLSSSGFETQWPLLGDNSTVPGAKKVAIIGSGIGGASTAFALQELTRRRFALSTTIYEAEAEIGGRIKNAEVYSQARNTIEIGASGFHMNDWCMVDAVRDVGLKIHDHRLGQGELMPPYGVLEPNRPYAVWNGRDFIPMEGSLRSSGWLDFIKMIYRYGRSPWITRRAFNPILERFKLFGGGWSDRHGNPFSSLRKELKEPERAGFTDDILTSADSYLSRLGISSKFQNEVVEPAARLRYAQGLTELRALDVAFAMRDKNSHPVVLEGGNSRLIDRLITLSGGSLRLNSPVTQIVPGKSRRYGVMAHNGPNNEGEMDNYEEYDAVIIAAPLQYSGIDISSLPTTFSGGKPQVRYIERHVTHFTSIQPISPSFFNLSTDFQVPANILTSTTNETDPEFFSITMLGKQTFFDRGGCEFDGECDQMDYEYLYRILSPSTLDDATLARMVGHEPDHKFRWVHRKAWPHAFPRYQADIPEDIEIAPDLYYPGAGDGVISSLEMGCRMGKNVAGKIYYKWRW